MDSKSKKGWATPYKIVIGYGFSCYDLQ